MKTLFLLSLCWLGADSLPSDAIVGEWLVPEGDAKVRISREADSYVGIISWMKEPRDKNGQPVVDSENPDPVLRKREVEGLRLLWQLKAERPGEYGGGYIYDPKAGKTYKMNAKLDGPDTLKLRGYVGVSLFGRTETWKRVGVSRKSPADPQ